MPDMPTRVRLLREVGAGLVAGFGGEAAALVCAPPLSPPHRTKWTRRIPHPVLIGHAASLSPPTPRAAPAPLTPPRPSITAIVCHPTVITLKCAWIS